MISFFFPRKKIVVDALCTSEQLCDQYPIAPAQVPSVITDMPSMARPPSGAAGMEHPTIRHCPAIRDLYTDSWALRAWAEYDLQTQLPGYVKSSSTFTATPHGAEQHGRVFGDNLINMKLISPWAIIDKSAVSWAFIGDQVTAGQLGEGVQILNGVVDYRHQHITNVNIMLPLPRAQSYLAQDGRIAQTQPEARKFVIRPGVSLALLRPITDLAVEVRCWAVSQGEFEARTRVWAATNFFNYSRYRAEYRRRAAQGQCPFGFGR